MSKPKQPSYRKHSSGQARVTLYDVGSGERKDFMLGKYGTKASRVEYDRIIAEWLSNGRRFSKAAVANDLTVNELIARFWKHAEQHYRRPDGTTTNELNDYRLSLRPVRELYGDTPAKDFGPLALRTVRDRMIADNLARGVVNQRIGRIKRMFAWAASWEILPESIHSALSKVEGLQRGRSDARETEPVKPVAEHIVNATMEHVSPTIAAMIELQWLTGMRSGEVCSMTTGAIDVAGKIWFYRPTEHKMSHAGRERSIALGPRSQAIVKQYLSTDLQAPLFSPARTVADRMVILRAKRRSKVQPSQRDRRKAKPQHKPGQWYNRNSYLVAIRRGCERAGVDYWHPHQLRHSAATRIRKEFSVEHAQVVLGHAQLGITQLYAEKNEALAATVAAKIG